MAEISPVIGERLINKQQVRQHFSVHARDYDRYAKVQQLVAKRLAGLLRSHQQPWSLALEVGCGTGLLSRQLLQLQAGLKLILSDLAHGMSQQVQQVLTDCLICDADAAALPFAAGTFDLVASSSVYQWLNDLPNAFAEVARVLRPDGTLAIAFFGEQTLHELRSSHQAILGDEKSHVQSFSTLDRVERAVPADLQIVALHSEFEVEWHQSVPDLLRSLKKIGAQNASQQRPQGFTSRSDMQQMITHYDAVYAGEAGIPATYEVIYLLAKRR